MLIFIGVLLVFSYFALALPSLATNHIFENQIEVLFGKATGMAAFDKGFFFDIFLNNAMVLLVIFITSFVLGEGGVFLIVWNASVWGTIFGNIARCGAANVNHNPYIYFVIIILTVSIHMLLEAFAYVGSATTGGVISKALTKEKLLSRRFTTITVNTIISLVFAFVILILAAIVETYVLGNATAYQTIIRQCFR